MNEITRIYTRHIKTFLSESFKSFSYQRNMFFAKQKSSFLSTGSFFRKKVSLRELSVFSLGYKVYELNSKMPREEREGKDSLNG
jgi:hypothetical protein